MNKRRKFFIWFIIFVLKSQIIKSSDVEDFTYSCGVHTPKKGIFKIIFLIFILLSIIPYNKAICKFNGNELRI